MKVTLFLKPDGKSTMVDMYHIHDRDAEWFESNGVDVSLEEGIIPDTYTVYADVGINYSNDPKEDPYEVIVFSDGDDCYSTMSRLRSKVEEAIEDAIDNDMTFFRGSRAAPK